MLESIKAVHVLEAVREPGSKHISYDTLLEIPLAARPPAASTTAATAVGSSPSVSNLRDMEAAEADFAPGESAVRQGPQQTWQAWRSFYLRRICEEVGASMVWEERGGSLT